MAILNGLALSRTCNLRDFPGCVTVAAWQQRLAEQAWAQWLASEHLRTREPSLCVNQLGLPFVAPGPTPIYTRELEVGLEGLEAEQPVSAVFGLSVLDHIVDPVRFLKRTGRILSAKGLLFLTFAFWDAEGPDVAAGADSRVRIYDVHSWKKLVAEARRAGFQTFGQHDWTYHGNMLDDHTLASLVLVRKGLE
jgi:hypothetical protein